MRLAYLANLNDPQLARASQVREVLDCGAIAPLFGLPFPEVSPSGPRERIPITRPTVATDASHRRSFTRRRELPWVLPGPTPNPTLMKGLNHYLQPVPPGSLPETRRFGSIETLMRAAQRSLDGETFENACTVQYF